MPSPIIKSISYFDNQVKTNAASTIDEHFWSVSYDVENFRIKVVNNTGAANFAPEIYQVIANPYTINRYIGSLVHSADSQVPLSVQVTQATQSPYVLQNTNSLKDFIANIQTVASSKNFVLGSDWKTQVTNIFNILDGKLGVVNTDKTRPNFLLLIFYLYYHIFSLLLCFTLFEEVTDLQIQVQEGSSIQEKPSY